MFTYIFLICIVFMMVLIVKNVFQVDKENFIFIGVTIGVIVFLAYNIQGLEVSVLLGGTTGLASCILIQMFNKRMIR